MSDTLDPQGAHWNEDEEEEPLPSSLLVFTSPELDRDQAVAREVPT